MRAIRDPAAMQAWSRRVRSKSETIAFVPTMGALHEGHLSLLRLARAKADHVVASIFVNPKQFGPSEDLARYPRDEDGDTRKCAEAGCELVFIPSVETMYPPGFQTHVSAGPLAAGLCGASRPGHFDGVVTVVLKLLLVVKPHVAIFGAKDYQQLQVVRRMVRDLSVDVEILPGAIVREPDGVAMSSRNALLTPEDRAAAVVLSRALARAEELVAAGERDPEAVRHAALAVLRGTPRADVDYVCLVDADELTPLPGPLERPAVLALAVRFGTTRLIDNRVLLP